MIIAIQDANILIDLHDAGLLDAYFRLGFETHTTDLVLREVMQPLETFVLRGQLRVRAFSETEMATLLSFQEKQPRSLTLQDCSVLQLAMQMPAVLLTGDNKLRNHAESKGIEAHGILWLLDLLLEENVLDPATAKSCLEQLMTLNPRLPAADCQQRLKLWAVGRRIAPKRPPPS